MRVPGSILAYLALGAVVMPVRAAEFFPPPGGWDYRYDGDAAASASGAALDGTWDHDNGSDQWDGTVPGTGNPGGVAVVPIAGEPGNNALLMVDAVTTAGTNNNRRYALTHDLAAGEGMPGDFLDDGATLAFRARLPSAATDLPTAPNGLDPHSGSKGIFNLKQDSGRISFAFGVAGTDPAYAQSGMFISDDVGTVFHALDPTDWNELWVTIRRKVSDPTRHDLHIYLNGAGVPAIVESVRLSPGAEESYPYLSLQLSSTTDTAAVEVDYLAFKDGVHLPANIDGDALPDSWELAYFPDLSRDEAGDEEPDGLTNGVEFDLGSNPTLADTDGDGLNDGDEFHLHGSDPTLADTDGDGLEDAEEVAASPATNPARADTDGDGLDDGAEVRTHGTDPTRLDSDGDGFDDGIEVAAGTNPLDDAEVPDFPTLGGVLVNEFLASNNDNRLDQDGDSSDWVELWNPTGVAIAIGGWFLTDDPADPTRWRLPDGLVLAPGEFLLIFASGKDRVVPGSELHTDFQLNKAAGSHLALMRPDGAGGTTTVSAYENYPVQVEDISFGVYGDLAPLATGYFATPTPGAANGQSAIAGFVADTKFSPNRGFYETPIEVVVTCATPGATIIYTTDGSVPDARNGTATAAPDPNTPPAVTIPIDTTTCLRAMATKPGLQPTNADTHTYVFANHVPDQPDRPRGFPTTWTGWDYGMDQDLPSLRAIVNNPAAGEAEAKAVISNALKALPTMSIVMDLDDLFGTRRGIYHNPLGEGPAWERPCSMELIDPQGGGLVQQDCGIRIQGFSSRDAVRNPKHSLRLVFRKQYGAGKLRYALFGDNATDAFDTIVLRSNAQDAWVYDSDWARHGQFVRDEWTRRTQLAMGRPAAHGMWVHLYLNGIYWGVHNPTERPDANFAASYFGGNGDDYDVVKIHEEVIDGNGTAYRELVSLVQNDPNNWFAGYRNFSSNSAYQALQGNAPDGRRDSRKSDYLDVPNMIDYMIHNMHAASSDWPGNYYMARDRTRSSTGFKFFSWDSDRVMQTAIINVNFDRTTADGSQEPTKFHQPLRSNAEYRMLFADRLHRAFFNDGVLTAENAAARWTEVTSEIEFALIAESARWGDYRRANPYTVEGDFKPLRRSLLTGWFPQRTDIVLGQFRAQNLYPNLAAPVFSRHGAIVPAGYLLGITAALGKIYYTLDGSDPRLPGGARNSAATAVGTESGGEIFVPLGADNWKYLDSGVAQSDSDLVAADPAFGAGDWKHRNFNDAAWKSGRAPLGYGQVGEPGVATEVDYGPEGGNRYPTTYFRKHFSVTGAANYEQLFISLRRDDGTILYLNGHQILRSNMPSGPVGYSTLATAGVTTEEGTVLNFVYALAPGQLLEGDNVLAAELHQHAVFSADLVIDLKLEGTRGVGANPLGAFLRASGPVKARVLHNGQWSALNEASFIVGLPAGATNLALTELLYKPLGGGTREFVEVMNIAASQIELSGVRFTDGINFTFPEGFILGPGERTLVVDNRAAFESAFGSGLPIAGEFTGDLANGGEAIELTAADGSLIRAFRYDDEFPWPVSPDTGGFSLTLIAPESNPDHADPANWRASLAPGGSPATTDATTFSGDPTADGDADGQAALLEHALGTSDNDPAERGQFVLWPGAGGTVSLRFTYNLAADDVVLTAEISDDLLHWETATAWTVVARQDLGEGRALVTLESPPGTRPLVQFVRLRVAGRP